jgi:molybdopterin synthase catalytic subunit
MYTYPHKIENSEGEVLTFFGVVRDRDGDPNFLLRLMSVRRCICTIFRKRP